MRRSACPRRGRGAERRARHVLVLVRVLLLLLLLLLRVLALALALAGHDSSVDIAELFIEEVLKKALSRIQQVSRTP